MGKWKDAFLKSTDRSRIANLFSFNFGRPAAGKQLAALEQAISAKIPDDLRELLQEFNGVNARGLLGKEEYFVWRCRLVRPRPDSVCQK